MAKRTACFDAAQGAPDCDGLAVARRKEPGMRRRTCFLVAVGLGAVLLTVGCGDRASRPEVHTASAEEVIAFPVTTTPRLVVDSARGDIVVRSGDAGDTVRVTATVRAEAESADAASALLEEIAPSMVQEGDAITLRFCDDSEETATTVDFAIEVPAHTSIDVSTGEGAISVFDTASSVVLRTGGGDIEVRTVEGVLDAETSAGDILFVGRFPPSETDPVENRMTTRDGLVEVYFEPAYVKIEATAPSGKISSEELFTVGGRSDTRWSVKPANVPVPLSMADRPPQTKVIVHNETGDIRFIHINVLERLSNVE